MILGKMVNKSKSRVLAGVIAVTISQLAQQAAFYKIGMYKNKKWWKDMADMKEELDASLGIPPSWAVARETNL